MAQNSKHSGERLKEELVNCLAECQKNIASSFNPQKARKEFEEFLSQFNDEDDLYDEDEEVTPAKVTLNEDTCKAYKVALQSENAKRYSKYSKIVDISSKQLQFRLKEFIQELKPSEPEVHEEELEAAVFEEDQDEGDDQQVNELRELLRKEKQDLYNHLNDVVEAYQRVLDKDRDWLIREIKGDNKRGFEECCTITAEGHLVGMKAGDYVQKLVKEAEDEHVQLIEERNDSVNEVAELLDRLNLF